MKKIIILLLIAVSSFANSLFVSPSDMENTGLFFSQDKRLTDNPAELYVIKSPMQIFVKGMSLIQTNALTFFPANGSFAFALNPLNVAINYQNIQWNDKGKYNVHKASIYAQKALMSDDDELYISAGVGASIVVGNFLSGSYKNNTYKQPGIGGSLGILTKYHKSRMSFFYMNGPNLHWNNSWTVKAGNLGSKFQLDYSFYLSSDTVFSISCMMRMPLIYPNPSRISSFTILQKEEVRLKLDYEKNNIGIDNLNFLISLYTINRENLNFMLFNEWMYRFKKVGFSLGCYTLLPIDKIELNLSVQGGISIAL